MICPSPSVLSTKVSVEIQFRIGGVLQFSKRMGHADQGLRVVGTERYIRRLRRNVTADAISRGYLESEVPTSS